MLGFRGSDEHRQLQWGDLKLKNDMNGQEYLQWNERRTKTRTGQPANIRQFQPKIYEAENKEKCPIRCFKMFQSHRPVEMNIDTSPFYLTVKSNIKANEKIWYKKAAMGKNHLGKIMKEICAAAGLKGKKTNHSIRKTMCTNLLHAGVPPTLIQQLSGHKNVQSLNNYATASENQQRDMCKILQNPVNLPQQSRSSNAPAIAQPQQAQPNPAMVDTVSTPFPSSVNGPFASAQISGGTFHLHFHSTNTQLEMKSPNRKRRRAVIYDDSDDN
jgi:hypothetical protein